jgi:hypothetical protein
MAVEVMVFMIKTFHTSHTVSRLSYSTVQYSARNNGMRFDVLNQVMFISHDSC